MNNWRKILWQQAVIENFDQYRESLKQKIIASSKYSQLNPREFSKVFDDFIQYSFDNAAQNPLGYDEMIQLAITGVGALLEYDIENFDMYYEDVFEDE